MMIAIYDTQTGQIFKRVSCAPSKVDIQADTGQEYYLNCPPEATHIIDNEPVTIGPTLDAIKAVARAEINSQRDRAESLPFDYLGKQFDADPISIKRLTLAVQAAQSAIIAGQTFTITWTCADNSTIDLDEQQMLGALQAMMLRGVELHEKARALKTQIDAAETAEEVAAIVW